MLRSTHWTVVINQSMLRSIHGFRWFGKDDKETMVFMASDHGSTSAGTTRNKWDSPIARRIWK